MKNRDTSYLFLLVLISSLCACQATTTSVDPAYEQEIHSWRQDRIATLMAPDGWLALAGLFWLKEGPNTFGAGDSNSIVFPAKAPDKLGIFWLEEDSVAMELLPGHEATVEEQKITSYALTGHATTPIIHFENLDWLLIQRTNKFGIRLWDRQHPKIQDTLHIDSYPIEPAWRLPAQWLPDSSGHTVKVRNVLDMEMDMETEGRLQFESGGQQFELIALDGGEDQFFMIFADATTGGETYGGGRYLYADRPDPDSDGQTFIDFNKAYNPPCAFTDFATCLLPPTENRLDLAIMAGEKSYGEH